MSKRLVIPEAEHCPFCGADKIFLKAFTEGVGHKRFAVSLQCSSCHVNGPQVFSEWIQDTPRGIGCFEDFSDKGTLIAKALEKWNTRH